MKDLTKPQKALLSELEKYPAGTELHSGELAERLSKKPAAVGKILKGLHANGKIAYSPEREVMVTTSKTAL